MKTVQKIAMVVSKVCECLYWVVGAVFASTLIASLAARDWTQAYFEKMHFGADSSMFNALGFELNVMIDGRLSMTAVSLLCFCTVLLAFLNAMVFRNIYLILKTTLGKTSFSRDKRLSRKTTYV